MHSLLHSFDKRVATQVALLPEWMNPYMKASSFMGLPAVVVTASLVIAVGCYLKGLKNISLAFALSACALGVNTIIKLGFQRPRPDTLYVKSMAIKSYSFPSGHAFGSMVFYGLIAYLCYRHLDRPFNIIAPGVLGALIFSIGLSRVSLGAHFPSDVLVGFALGAIAFALIIKVCGI